MCTSCFCNQVPFPLNSVVLWCIYEFFCTDISKFCFYLVNFLPNFYYPFLLFSLLLCDLLGAAALHFTLCGVSQNLFLVFDAVIIFFFYRIGVEFLGIPFKRTTPSSHELLSFKVCVFGLLILLSNQLNSFPS